MDFDFSSDAFNWRMDLKEIDTNDVSSFRVFLEVELKHPTGKFTFTADDIWFDAGEWDQFEAAIREWPSLDCDEALFSDMSQYVKLTLQKKDAGASVSVSIYEPLTDGCEANLSSGSNVHLDSDFLTKLHACFVEWPKHW